MTRTEIILFGSKKHLAELNIKSLSVAGTDVSVASEPVRNLGAMFDSQLIMAPHVKSVVKKSSFHLRNIGKARRVLTEDATKTVMQSLVMSRLDYCNALLIGIQQDLIAKLQRLQNSAARIVSRTRKYETYHTCFSSSFTGYQSNSASNLRSYCWYTRR